MRVRTFSETFYFSLNKSILAWTKHKFGTFVPTQITTCNQTQSLVMLTSQKMWVKKRLPVSLTWKSACLSPLDSFSIRHFSKVFHFELRKIWILNMLIKISSRPKVLMSFSFSLMSNGMQFYTTMLFLIITFYYWIRRKQTTGTFIICQQKVLFPASSSNAFHNCIKAIREQACFKSWKFVQTTCFPCLILSFQG